MPMEVRCATCQAVMRISEALRGREAKCPRCQTIFRVPGNAAPSAPPVVSPIQAAPRPPVPRPAAPRAAAPASFSPVPANKRSKSVNRGVSPWVWIGIGGGAFIAIALIITVLIFVLRPSSPDMPLAAVPAPDIRVPVPEQPPVAQPPIALPPVQPPIAPPPAVRPEDMPKAMDRNTITRVKGATTYLKVTTTDGKVSEGSGFFGAEAGIVLTNAHVLGMMRIDSPKPKSIEIVLNSGEPNEVRMTGQALGVDLETDLAVVKAEGAADKMPPPLAMDTSASLIELQPVFVFGFPLGSQVGKNITVASSSISSLRRDAASGELNQIQINGGLHPGNSGGPVVDTRGVVVGVAVSGIKGTQLQFAVPTDSISGLLNGRVADVQPGAAFVDGGSPKLPLRLALFDPLSRTRNIQLESWVGAADRPVKDGAQPGDGPRSTAAVVVKDQAGVAEIPYSAVPEGKSLWVQAVLLSQSGVKIRTAAMPVKVADFAPIERKAAHLKHDFARQTERTLSLKSSTRIRVIEGGQHKVFSEVVDYTGLEVLSSEAPDATRFHLHPGKIQFTIDSDGKILPPNTPAENVLRQVTHSYVIAANGSVKSRSQPGMLGSLPPVVREDATLMYNDIANTFEATFLPLPNRETMPLETWSATLPIWMIADRKPEMYDLKVQCTYEGVRSQNGRNLAHIRMEGMIGGRDPSRPSRGQAAGSAWVDLDQGFVSEAKVHVRSEVGAGQIKVVSLLDFELGRVAGNPQQLALVKPSKGPIGPAPNDPPPGIGGRQLVGTALVRLDPNSPTLKFKPGHRFKDLTLTATAGRTYQIEATNGIGAPGPFLIVANTQGKTLTQGPPTLLFRPTTSGAYPILATTTFPGRTGTYTVRIYEVSGNVDIPPVAVNPSPPPMVTPPVDPARGPLVKPPAPKNLEPSPARAAGPVLGNTIALDIRANSLCYDPYAGLLYVAASSASRSYPNSLIAVKPATGDIAWTIPMSDDPWQMALAPSGKALWVAFASAPGIRRVDLKDRRSDDMISLPNGTHAESLVVLPGATDVVAVSLKRSGSPRHAGIVILDNGKPRPVMTREHTGANVLVATDDPVVLFGYNNETTEFGVRRFFVDADGIREDRVFKDVLSGFHGKLTFAAGRIFSSNGTVLDAKELKSLGKINAGEVHVDAAGKRIFVLPEAKFRSDPTSLFIYDLDSLAQKDVIAIPKSRGPGDNLFVQAVYRPSHSFLAPIASTAVAVATGPKIQIFPIKQ